MKLLMLAKSSFKKNRSSAITLLFLIITATLFLYIGLHVLSNLSSFLDKKHESLNGADFLSFIHEANSDYVASILEEMDEVSFYEQEKAIIYFTGTIQNKKQQKNPQSIGFILLNMDTKRSLQNLKMIDTTDKLTEDSIILPYSLKSSHGYRVGDKIEIGFQNNMGNYTVYGFYEDIFFSTASNISFYKCYVPDQTFQRIYSSTDKVSRHTCTSALLNEGVSSGDFEDTFVKKASLSQKYDSGTSINLNIESTKVGTTLTINILMMILIIFAALILIISMVVIRYTVITHIEEDIKNIGSMEAIGFTSKMIQASLIIEFLIITTLGFVIGILISVAISGVVTSAISSSIGLNWLMEPGILSMLISFIVITLTILIITIKVTRRLSKITPLMALRNGIDTYHFGKNHFPLEKSRGSLSFLLGIKQILNNKKQSISMTIIATIMSFIIVFSISMYYNFVYDENAFIKLVGMERSDLAVASYGNDYETVYDIAASTPGIAKSLNYMSYTLTVAFEDKEISTNTFICDDFDKLTYSTIIEGRYPKHDNEIVISSLNQKKLGVEIGDVITLKSKETSYEYMVVGISQHISNLGRSVSITEDGMRRFSSTFIPRTLYLYLEEDVSATATLKLLEDRLEGLNMSIVDMDEIFDTTLSSITQSLTIICITIGVITSLIVVLILYYLVKVKLLREKNLIGINKALGFTTGQLILQNIISHGVIILFSALLGGLLAVLTINPICILMLSATGISNGSFIIPPILIGISLLIMESLTLITTTLVSIRIRKVNPRELMTD